MTWPPIKLPGDREIMNVISLARGLAINRISFGVGLVLAPGLYARSWVGSKAAAEETTKVLARALGARDLVLGAGGLLALRHEDSERARRWFTAQGVADAVDFLATIVAREVPLPARAFAAAMAAASAAIAAAYVRSAMEQAPQRRPLAATTSPRA